MWDNHVHASAAINLYMRELVPQYDMMHDIYACEDVETCDNIIKVIAD